MWLINVNTRKLEKFATDVAGLPPYAILSHRWGSDHEEINFQDAQKLRFTGPGAVKLFGCFKQARSHGLKYLWVDTCCIDKSNKTELDAAIFSMFRLYEKSARCYVYLSDVSTRDSSKVDHELRQSRWFQRGWTLQELIAPKTMSFYGRDWTFLGTKNDLVATLSSITRIPHHYLLGVDLGEASAAQRMAWAAGRVTKETEDVAYSLLGIFGITMDLHYGEGKDAFIRLQQEILRQLGDDSILAWRPQEAHQNNKSQDQAIEGAFATSPSDFRGCEDIIPASRHGKNAESLQVHASDLKIDRRLHSDVNGQKFILLRCYPDHDTSRIVGIPVELQASDPTGKAHEYRRLRGEYPKPFPTNVGEAMSKPVWMRIIQYSSNSAINEEYAFYIENHLGKRLELKDVVPTTNRDPKTAHVIVTKRRSGRQRTLLRFQHERANSLDFIVILDFEWKGPKPQTKHHVLVASRTTKTAEITESLDDLRAEAFEKHEATNGTICLSVTVGLEFVGEKRMFKVRLTPTEQLSQRSVDITEELRQRQSIRELAEAFQSSHKAIAEAKKLENQVRSVVDEIAPLKTQIADLEATIRKLKTQQSQLEASLGQEVQVLDNLEAAAQAANVEKLRLVTKAVAIQKEIGDPIDGSNPVSRDLRGWRETVVRLLIQSVPKSEQDWVEGQQDNAIKLLGRAICDGNSLTLNFLLRVVSLKEMRNETRNELLEHAAAYGAKEMVHAMILEGAHSQDRLRESINASPLANAAYNKRDDVVALLLHHGAEVQDDPAPLAYAALNGQDRAVKLLLDGGAAIDLKFDAERGRCPLSIAVSKDQASVVRILLDHGAYAEIRDDEGCTPLAIAAQHGCTKSLDILLKGGHDVEAKNIEDRTPLALAARHGRVNSLITLLDYPTKRVNKETKDAWGYTPLALAAREGSLDCVRALASRGALLETKDNKGLSPLELATSRRHENVVKFLQERIGVSKALSAGLHNEDSRASEDVPPTVDVQIKQASAASQPTVHTPPPKQKPGRLSTTLDRLLKTRTKPASPSFPRSPPATVVAASASSQNGGRMLVKKDPTSPESQNSAGPLVAAGSALDKGSAKHVAGLAELE